MRLNTNIPPLRMTLLLITFLFPLYAFCQDLSGVWTGTMYNDTTRQNIHYELAINESDSKVDGYSHTTFIINGIKNIGVKEVKIKMKNDQFYIVDEKFVYNNYTEPPAKGVKMSSDLILSENDSAEVLSGSWKTNATKLYRPLTGTLFLERKKKVKPEETIIVAKLIQLGLWDNLSFLTTGTAANVMAINNKPPSPEKNISTGISSEELKAQKAREDSLKAEELKAQEAKEALAKAELLKAQKARKDSLKAEELKAQAAKEALAKAELLKAQKAREDSLKAEELKAQEAKEALAKAELLKAQKGREDSLKAEQLKAQEAKEALAKAELLKAQKAREDSLKAEELKAQEAKEALAKAELLKAQKGREDSLKAEQLKAQEAKEALAKAELLKAQKAREDSLKAEELKAQEAKEALAKAELLKAQKAREDSLKAEELKAQEAKEALAKAELLKAQKAREDSLKAEQLKAQKAKDDLAKAEQLKAQKLKDDLAKAEQLSVQKAKDDSVKSEQLSVQKAKEAIAKSEESKTESLMPKAAADIQNRKIETIRTVEISQDSLVFSLYDNGVVDGDTVSVLLNGKVIWPRVGLLERAKNKTIYLTPDMGDSISIIMYAENLGSIPPNTGLLVIREAQRIYEIRFSGDLNKNAEIILVRKKKE